MYFGMATMSAVLVATRMPLHVPHLEMAAALEVRDYKSFMTPSSVTS